MGTPEEFFSRLLGYLRDDLAKENLSSRAETNRLELIRITESIVQDSLAKQIISKYDNPPAAEVEPGEHRTGVLRGNSLPIPFTLSSAEVKGNDNNNNILKRTDKNQNPIVTYESAYELPVSDFYEEVVLAKSSRDSCSGGGGGGGGGSEAADKRRTYEELSAFDLIAERIPEASDSDGGTDYEEYCNEDEKQNNREVSNKKTKINKENAKVDLDTLQYFGSLYQKGPFNQNRRRFCGIRGGTFVCWQNESSVKVVHELALSEYEVVHHEKPEAKVNCSQELRFSCPGKETQFFYTDSKQDADNWVKELRKFAAIRVNGLEINADEAKTSTDHRDDQSECSETNISGGSLDRNSVAKTPNQNHQQTDDARKKSKLQALFGTVGKKLGNKSKNLLHQSSDFSNSQQLDEKPDTGYLSIRSEEYTGDRWFRRFCRIEDGQLNCYKDHVTGARPEFSLGLRGAQLKPFREKDELKITVVQNRMEHCLQMDNFMDHGKWLMSLIRETGFAQQLAGTSKQKAASLTQDSEAGLYEELTQFYDADDVILDESCPDDEPPPVPIGSSSSSPCFSESLLSGAGGGEGIYLEPSEWKMDLEEIKAKKKLLKTQNALKISPTEESIYVNREFLVTEEKPSKETEKDDRKNKSPMIASSSFPNLFSAGKTKMENGVESKRKISGVVKKLNIISRKQNNCPRSSLENSTATTSSEKKSCEEDKVTIGKSDIRLVDNTDGDNSTKKNLTSTSASTQENKQVDYRVKTPQSYCDSIGIDLNKINRSHGTDSVSNEDLSSSTRHSDYDYNSKNVVKDLVKMFEGRKSHC